MQTMRYLDPGRPTRHSQGKADRLRRLVRELASDRKDPTLAEYLEPGRIDEVVHVSPGAQGTVFTAIRRSPEVVDRVEAAMGRHGRLPILSVLLGGVASGQIVPGLAELISDAALDFAAAVPDAGAAGIYARDGGDVVLMIGTEGGERWSAQYPLRGSLPVLGPEDPPVKAKRKAAKRA